MAPNHLSSADATTTTPIACRLQGGDRQARLQEWRDLARRGLVGKSRDGGVLTTVWDSGAGVGERLRELVAAEQRCCPFLDFEVEERGAVILVRTLFPAGAEELLESFV